MHTTSLPSDPGLSWRHLEVRCYEAPVDNREAATHKAWCPARNNEREEKRGSSTDYSVRHGD